MEQIETTRPTQMIEYVHVVGWYDKPIASPDRVSSSQAVVLNHAFKDEDGDYSYLAFAEDVESAQSPWVHDFDSTWKIEGTSHSLVSMEQMCRGVPSEKIHTLMLTKEHKHATKRFVDFLWTCEYETNETWTDDPTACVGFAIDAFSMRRSDCTQVRRLVDELVRLSLAAKNPYYLLVDVTDAGESGGNSYYASGPEKISSRLSRMTEKRLWESMGKARREHVRGVFWGNYFNPTLLERLGGKDRFRAEYLAHAKEQVGEWENLVTDTPSGGLFVCISDTPMDESRRSGIPHCGVENAVWLHKRLRAIGALI